MRTVGVVGAGAIGASVAFCLARRGVRVHCFERARPGGLTTDVSFARLSAYQQPTYERFELSHTGIIEHTHFARQFASAPWWHPTGSLAWAGPGEAGGAGDARSFAEVVDQLDAWGYRVIRTDAAEVNREREAGVVFPNDRTPAVVFPEEGWIDGPRLVAELLAAARKSGRLRLWNSAVDGVEQDGERVVALRLQNQERIEVDAVVNAAGPETTAVASLLRAPAPDEIAIRSSLVVDLVVEGDPVRHILRGADVHVRSAGPGRVRARSEQVDARLPADSGSEPDDRLVEELLERVRRTVPALASARTERIRVGTAVFPADGLPSVGALSGVTGYYEAFANSGITLAPFIGRTLATEITTGKVHPLWDRCSPDRLRAST